MPEDQYKKNQKLLGKKVLKQKKLANFGRLTLQKQRTSLNLFEIAAWRAYVTLENLAKKVTETDCLEFLRYVTLFGVENLCKRLEI